MKSNVPSHLESKQKDHLQIDKEELRQTLQQVKLLKIKTNQKIHDYEKANQDQKKEIELLKEALRVKQEQVDNFKLQLQNMGEIREDINLLSESKLKLSNQVEQKVLLIEYLRKETEEFQKKYYGVKEELEIKLQEICEMKKQKCDYENKINRINKLLGIHSITQIDGFSFLQSSDLTTYLQEQKQAKLKIQNDITFLNEELMIREQAIVELKQQSTQFQQLLQLANQKNQILEETQKNLKQVETELRHELSLKMQDMNKLQDESFLLKSSMLSFGQQIERQKQIIKQFTFKQQQDQKELQLHREYNLLIDQVMNEKQQFSIVNSQIQMLELFKTEHQSNINKMKFLCKQLDSC